MPDQQRVLVTGANGFTGSHLCRLLKARGHHVVGMVRDSTRTKSISKYIDDYVVADLRDPQALKSAVANISTVYHIAAAFREVSLSDADYEAVNIRGTEYLLDAAISSGVQRFVHCSTIGVHGDTGKTPASEESPYNPPDHYCKTKLDGELLAREKFDQGGIEGSVFRPLGIYGPGDSRFLKLFRGLAKRRFVMIGDGETLYHLTYIDDLCQGIMLLGDRQEAVGEVFILGGNGYVTLNQFVDTVADAVDGKLFPIRIPMAPVMAAAYVCEAICRPFGIEPPLYPRRVEFFSKDRAADISKARTLLGYEPRFSLEEGVRLTAASYRKSGWLPNTDVAQGASG